MFRKPIAACALALLAGGFAGADAQSSPDAQQIDGIVAIVNDDPISISDVRQRARLLLLSLGGSQPTQEQIQQITSQALEELIDERLQLQEAAEYEVEISDQELQAGVSDMAQRAGMQRDDLVNILLQAGVNPASLEEQTRAEIAWRRIMGGLYGSRIRVSENQIERQLSRLRSALEQTQFQISELFLYAPTEAERQEALAGARSIMDQVQNGAPFEVAAQRFSSSPTAATGGDMGWVTLEDLDPALATAVRAMSGPGYTDPIATENGIYILQLRNRRDPATRTTLVDLVRLIAMDGSEENLQAAISSASDCDELESLAETDDNLEAAVLEGLNIEDLAPDGRSMVLNTPIGSATASFPITEGGIGAMYICDRADGVENLPDRDTIEDRLFSQELSMISQRELRNLRREATIIRR